MASKLELLRNSCDVHLACAGAFLCDLREALSVCLAAHSKEVILETLTYEIYVITCGDRACDTELMLRYKLKTLVLLNQIEPISWDLAHSGSR